MQERYIWAAFGGGAALLVAVLISLAMGGPGWPYFLGLGVVAFGVAFAMSVRKERDET